MNLNETQPIYAYKHYGYKNYVPIHSSQMQTIFIVKYTSLAYFAVGQNANIFVPEILTNLLHRTLQCTFRKEIFLREKMKKRREFLQLIVETSLNKLSPLPKKDNK